MADLRGSSLLTQNKVSKVRERKVPCSNAGLILKQNKLKTEKFGTTTVINNSTKQVCVGHFRMRHKSSS